MKKIDTSKLMEVKLRIYSYGTIERLSKCFEKHRADFRNKNEFLIHVITNGLDILELQDENFKDYYQKMENISEKITHFENHLSVKENSGFISTGKFDEDNSNEILIYNT